MSDFGKELLELSEAVDKFSLAMKRRLLEKLRAGYGGWNDPEKVPDFNLIVKMGDDIHSEHPETKSVDIANRAMMLWYRDQLRR